MNSCRADNIADTAPAPDVSPISAAADPCQFPDAKISANCRRFLANPEIPRDALLWTLDVFRQNTSGLKLKKCLKEFGNDHYSLKGITPEKIKRGIKNKCQILINDTRAKHNDFKLRGTFYYLDLCDGTMSTDYFNLGENTFNKNEPYSNDDGDHATVLGAFLTSDQDFSYEPAACVQWRGKKRRRRCVKTGLDPDYKSVVSMVERLSGKPRSPAVALIGLQNTNNNSATSYKYLHCSPYRSSWGCPSVNPAHYKMIETLAQNGPSLVVNYGPESKMEDPAKCTEN